MSDVTKNRLLRFADLYDRGIVNNWQRVKRLQDTAGFPKGYLLSPGCRVWDQAEVEAWLASRRARSETGEAA
jgi:hypothetical protein